MKQYETPKMEYFKFELVDIITGSPEVESSDNPVDNVDGGGDQSW